MSSPLALNYSMTGNTGEPVFLLHGLYGSGANWRGIARRFADSHRVYTPDLRCHGRSPHASDMSYLSLAADVLALFDAQAIEQAPVVGHSMGGKVAMTLALLAPERISRLMVVDIAPVTYDHSQEHGNVIAALQALDLSQIKNREAADLALSAAIPNAQVRQFLLTNLQQQQGQWSWRIPLEIFADQLPALQAWPEPLDRADWAGPAEFVYGGRSNYVTASHTQVIKQRFPSAITHCIEDVGHWVHAENPDAFLKKLQPFLIGKNHV